MLNRFFWHDNRAIRLNCDHFRTESSRFARCIDGQADFEGTPGHDERLKYSHDAPPLSILIEGRVDLQAKLIDQAGRPAGVSFFDSPINSSLTDRKCCGNYQNHHIKESSIRHAQ